MDGDAYDYVIVGAGTAGCVLADRLSEDGTANVLLIERGGPARHPRLHVPQAYRTLLDSPRHAYRYRTEPASPGGEGEGEVWVRGRVLGGSSAINGMLYLRGDPADYHALASAGGPTWAWEPMLAAFRAMEDHALGASELRGAGGPLPISITAYDDELTCAIIDAAAELGMRSVADVNASTLQRIGFAPTTIRDGRRVSAAAAFLRRAEGRANLHVLDHARVGFLLVDGRRVIGVRAQRGGETRDLRAHREVLLAAGAVESPLLLERSGIGDPELLARAGIEQRVPSPAVGRGVIEQRAVRVTARVVPSAGATRLATMPQRIHAVARYLTRRRGPLATGDDRLVAALRSNDAADRPDAQLTLSPRLVGAESDGGGREGVAIRGFPLRPTTRSEVHVGGPMPEDPPRIEPHFLETEADRRTTAGILRRARELLASPPLAALVTAEIAPGPSVAASEGEASRYAMASGQGIYHAVGSCAMGPSGDDVVDGSLRVRGVSGLRVIDASVFPAMPSGGTAAPTMALAWRAAGTIRGE